MTAAPRSCNLAAVSIVEGVPVGTRGDTRGLQAVAMFFAALGLVVAIFGDGPALAPWRAHAAQALLGEAALPDSVEALASITDGILGGTIAGKWVAAWWLVRVPLARGEPWAKRALLWGLATWFVVDSAVCLAHGALFNLWMINAVPLVVFGGLVLRFDAEDAPSPALAEVSRSWRALEIACWVSAAMGLVIAFAIDTAVFAPWRAAAANVLGGGAGDLAPQSRTWLAFVGGPIGGTTVGHFVMLAIATRRAPGQRWVLAAIATSVAMWFAIDSGLSIARGAAFNVVLVNLPALALVAVPLVWATTRR